MSNHHPSNRRTANTETCKVAVVPRVSGKRPSAGSAPAAVADARSVPEAVAARTALEAPDGASRAIVRSVVVRIAVAVARTRTREFAWVCGGQDIFPTGFWLRDP